MIWITSVYACSITTHYLTIFTNRLTRFLIDFICCCIWWTFFTNTPIYIITYWAGTAFGNNNNWSCTSIKNTASRFWWFAWLVWMIILNNKALTAYRILWSFPITWFIFSNNGISFYSHCYIRILWLTIYTTVKTLIFADILSFYWWKWSSFYSILITCGSTYICNTILITLFTNMIFIIRFA